MSKSVSEINTATHAYPADNNGNNDHFLADAGRWTTGKVLLKDYQIQRILGKGGLGIVYLVKNLNSHSHYYAIKTLLESVFQDEESREAFLRELLTWIELPKSNHMVACRFFRTIEDRLVIFSEFVNGGSLAEWIQKGKLNSLPAVIDVGIQMAWGLESAHRSGVVHQDVKPQNVLLTKKGIAKITDFGLARAREASVTWHSSQDSTSNLLVTSAGMTLPYCSPEQARGEKLNPQTDIWSWGVTFLEMLTGKLTWRIGLLARSVLDSYMQDSSDKNIRGIPDDLSQLLAQCFEENLSERWKNFADVVDVLKDIYARISGHPYSRKKPPIHRSPSTYTSHTHLVSDISRKMENPIPWIKKACEAVERTGLNVTVPNLETNLKKSSNSAIVYIDAYRKLAAMFETLIEKGFHEYLSDAATLETSLAEACIIAGDAPGALEAFNQATDNLEQLLNSGDLSILVNLIRLYDNKGVHIQRQRDFEKAIETYNKYIHLAEKYRDVYVEKIGWNHLARCYSNKALCMLQLGQFEKALSTFDEGLYLLEKHLSDKNKAIWIAGISDILQNKAFTYTYLGNMKASIPVYNKAIHVLESIDGIKDFSYQFRLARLYLHKSSTLLNLGKRKEALELSKQAISLGETLVFNEGQGKYSPELSQIYMNHALILHFMGNLSNSLLFYDKTIKILEKLVFLEGHSQNLHYLFKSYNNKGLALQALGQDNKALYFFQKAKHIMDRLIEAHGQKHLFIDFARLNHNTAVSHHACQRFEQAYKYIDSAISIWQALLNEKHTSMLVDLIARGYHEKSSILLDNEIVDDAYDYCQRAIASRERLYYVEKKEEIADFLGKSYNLMASILRKMGRYQEALTFHAKAENLFHNLLSLGNRKELTGQFALIKINKALTLNVSGSNSAAEQLADECIPVLKMEYEKTGQEEYRKGVQNWNTQQKSNIINKWETDNTDS